MFDFGVGYTELLVIALVAIIVIGPKDLPKVLRALGRMTAKLRGMAREFQGHMDAAMREAGLDEIKKDIQSIQNPLTEVKAEIAADIKKQDEDFKKYFGGLDDAQKDEPKTEAAAGAPPVLPPTAAPVENVPAGPNGKDEPKAEAQAGTPPAVPPAAAPAETVSAGPNGKGPA